MMYRVIAIVCAGLGLAACESNADWMKTPDWMKSPDFSKMSFGGPVQENVRLESEPSGAEAKTTSGQSCRTPCSLALPANAAMTVTFNLAGYQPESEKLQLVSMGDGTSQLRPNPVLVELTPLPPSTKKPVASKKKKKTATKPAPRRPATAAAPQPPMAQQPQQATSPWPTAPSR
jgi:hypothetical protein